MAKTEKLRNKLMTKLTELFQLDQPDLDFGFYRIMQAKAQQVKSFIDKDLLQIIEDAFGQVDETRKAEAATAVHLAIEQAIKYGAPDPEDTDAVKEARRKYDEIMHSAGAEADVYDHLYRFFERYYDEGDFISRRYYARENAGKAAPFAIPYNGEEVKLHWANADQYYIKTAEYFSNYSFDITQAAEIRRLDELTRDGFGIPDKPLKVHFRIVDASEGEHGNVKAAEDKKRFFILHEENPVEFNETQELVINFEYKALPSGKNDVDADTEKALKEKFGKSLNKGDMPNLAIAEKVIEILSVHEPHERHEKGKEENNVRDFSAFRGPEYLSTLRLAAPTDKISNRPLLAKYINQYTARNTMDYFIHKDLGAFLKRELDFYIKNEVMHLDDIENADAPAVENYLAKLKVIRKIATKLIDFLAQLEDFQKKLWLKKKFVTETNYCITLDRIPEELYEEIAANEKQYEEWEKLGFIDFDVHEKHEKHEMDLFETSHEDEPKFQSGKFSDLSCLSWIKENKFLVLDTAFFSSDFKAKLIASIEDFDEQCDGLLIHSENFQALNLLQERYREQVKCVYIDPPYNTGKDDNFAYKDNYQHSSWMSMIYDRVVFGKGFVTKDAAIFASIDEVEQPNFRQIFDTTWGAENFVADMVWAAGRKNDSRLVSVSHEYMLVYANNRQFLSENKIEWRQRKKGLDEIYAQHKKLKKEFNNDYAAMTAGLKDWYKNLADGHPSKAHKHYSCIDKRGVYFPDNISWPGGGGPKYQVLHPVTGKPVKVPSGGWRFSQPETMQTWIDQDRIHFGTDEKSVPCRKSYLIEHESQTPYSIFYQDGRAATRRLREVLGQEDFGYPKDETVIAESIGMLADKSDLLLDYFAGSGTTGHAVINLNREDLSADGTAQADNGNRKYILVEMGDYFDTVLKPRITKVIYSSDWKNGKPVPSTKNTNDTKENNFRDFRAFRGQKFNSISHCFKYLRLESYEDTLNNLVFDENPVRGKAIESNPSLKEDYMIRYLLNVETRGSQSLLNIDAFADPTAYALVVKRPGSDEQVTQNIDLIETFNYLLGLRLENMAAPQTFTASFTRKPDPELSEDQNTKLVVDGKIKQIIHEPHERHEKGKEEKDVRDFSAFRGQKIWWFRKLEGWVPADPMNPNNGQKERVLIVWRKLTGNLEEDNLMLDEWFEKYRISTRDFEYDTIYVNGSNNLPNLRKDDENWKVRLIEEEFHKKMWEME